jgi:outer membrane receptor protein involved in Fe transport
MIRFRIIKLRLLALMVLFVTVGTAGAEASARKITQQNDSIGRLYSLKSVEVTGSPLKQKLNESYSQTDIEAEAVEEKIATSLIDMLEEVPGITKRGEYHSPIVLRGLGGKRLLITRDGNRRMGNFPNGFMGEGTNIYDLAKVEVIKGPASVMYGPGAIAGIINMESKSPFLTPGLHGRVVTSYGSNNEEKTLLAGLNYATLDHALSASVRYRDAEDYQMGKGVSATNSYYHDKDFRLSHTWENNYAFSVRTESELHLGGPWGRPLGFNGTSQMKVYNTDDDTWHTSATVAWQPEKVLKKSEVSVYCDLECRRQVKDSYDMGTGRLSYREDIRYRNVYGGWRGLAVLSPRTGMILNLGSDGVIYRIESPTTLTDYFLSTVINNKVTKNSGVFMGGLFAETEFKPVDRKIKFRVGLRADLAKVVEGNVHDTLLSQGRSSAVRSWNGTTSAVYQVQERLFASFQIARSCRMPDASEMFISTSNSDGYIYGNPSLRPEYGLNLDAGFRGALGFLFFDLSLFSNFLHDFISLEYWNNSGKRGINYTYYNVDKARIFGGEFSLGAKFKPFFSPDNQMVYDGMFVYSQGDKLTDVSDWLGKGAPLRNIPPFNTKQSLMFRRLVNSSVSWYLGGDLRYYATQKRFAPTADGGYVSPSYALFGVSAGVVVKRGGYKCDFRLRGDNLADNKYRPFETLVCSMGRNLKGMVTVSF